MTDKTTVTEETVAKRKFPCPKSKKTLESSTEQSVVKSTPPHSWVQDKYEGFWLYSESHPWRLAQHITLRGVFMGAQFGLVGGTGYALIKKRGVTPLLPYIGKITARGAVGGGIFLGLVAAQRCWTLPPVGVEDRSYRISYNWAQTKWDYISCFSGLVGVFLLRRPVGGILPAASIGVGLGNFAYYASRMM